MATMTGIGYQGTVDELGFAQLSVGGTDAGVLGGVGDSSLQCSPVSGALQVSIAAGACVVPGVLTKVDAPLPAPVHDVNTSASNRLDLVVARADWVANQSYPAIIKGTPGGPLPSPLVVAGTTFDVPLCQATARQNAGAFTAADLIDLRGWLRAGTIVQPSSTPLPSPLSGRVVYQYDIQTLQIANGASWSALFVGNAAYTQTLATVANGQGGTLMAVGNGTLVHRRVRLEHNLVSGCLVFLRGSTTNVGSSVYVFSYPNGLTPYSPFNGFHGIGRYNIGGSAYKGCTAIAGANGIYLLDNTNNAQIGGGMTGWGSGDVICANYTYEVAV